MAPAKSKGFLPVGSTNDTAVEITKHPPDMFRDDRLLFKQQNGRAFHLSKMGRAASDGPHLFRQNRLIFRDAHPFFRE